jgi:hypothetical protein
VNFAVTFAIFAGTEVRDGGDPTGQRDKCSLEPTMLLCLHRDYRAFNDREVDLVNAEEI